MYGCRDNPIDMQNVKNRPEKVLNHIRRFFIGAEAQKMICIV